MAWWKEGQLAHKIVITRNVGGRIRFEAVTKNFGLPRGKGR